jgi:hypothetical protein
MKYTPEDIQKRIESIQYVLNNPKLVSITPEMEKDLRNRLADLQQKLTPHEESQADATN